MNRKPKTAVLYGGNSSEREVSCLSGMAVSQTLKSLGYDIVDIDVRDDFVRALKVNKIKSAFLALHGAFGEDGQIQSILDGLNIAYTGSGAEASRLGMDKCATKRLLVEKGVPTPAWILLKPEDGEARLTEAVSQLGLPVIVKPPADGSSIGISLADDTTQLAEAVAKARHYDDCVLLEQFIAGRELTVGILNGVVLPVIEIVCDGLFDYLLKYTKGRTKYELNPHLEDSIAERVRDAALKTYRCIGCSGAARVDIRLDDSGTPFVLEINTIPGMTATSLVPKAAAAVGIDFPQLCEMMLADALEQRSVKTNGEEIGEKKATA